MVSLTTPPESKQRNGPDDARWTKTALRAFAQSELKSRITDAGWPRRYDIMVYEDIAHWERDVGDHETLYGPGLFLTKAEAWKQIEPRQVLDVFVYAEITPEDSFGELRDQLVIDLAAIEEAQA